MSKIELNEILVAFSELIDSYNSISEISTKSEYEKNLEEFPAKYELMFMRLVYIILQTKVKNLSYFSKDEIKLLIDIVEGKTSKSIDSLKLLNEMLPYLLKILAFSYTVCLDDYMILEMLLYDYN